MKRQETRIVIATYCDYCGAELTDINHSSIILEGGAQMDFCNTYTERITQTCLDKFKAKTRRNKP